MIELFTYFKVFQVIFQVIAECNGLSLIHQIDKGF